MFRNHWLRLERKRLVIDNYNGEKLVGVLHETGSKDAVIVCHGFQSWKKRIPIINIAAAFQRQGTENLRAVDAAILSCLGTRLITAIIGHSKGGNVVLLHASKYNDIPVVVNLERGIEGCLGQPL
ncbi:hypothetical protein Ddye_019161 [Dipteronia dyeriana]|uniref:Uncharacterized protein n=1 Tax=Dipteronia dyeriana TaxID=168575 RepID=A0AAD9WUT1_9ROSI|nr:hypothetical protein Ddye_019161 [Dipteronia dyeriana]